MNTGALLFVEKKFADLISISVTVADTARRPVELGTPIRAVRETQLPTEHMTLSHVPINHRGRTHLRLFDIRFANGHQAPVRIYDLFSSELLFNDTINFAYANPDYEYPLAESPGYAEIQLDQAVRGGGDRLLRIEIDIPAGLKLWSFASFTDSETQHVTIYSPEP